MARTLLARVCVLLLPLRPVAYISSSVRLAARPRARAMAARVEMSAGLKRVVVTGMGITSCLGNTLEDVKKSLYDAEPGITFNEKYAELGLRSHVCGRPEIEEDEFKEVIDRKNMRFMGTNAKYAYLAMDRAIKDSGMEASDYQNPRAGGILGQVRRIPRFSPRAPRRVPPRATPFHPPLPHPSRLDHARVPLAQGGTSLPDIIETVDAVLAGKMRQVGPYRVTRTMGSTVSAVLTTAFKLQGISYSISSACSTGAHCIGTAMEQVRPMYRRVRSRRASKLTASSLPPHPPLASPPADPAGQTRCHVRGRGRERVLGVHGDVRRDGRALDPVQRLAQDGVARLRPDA